MIGRQARLRSCLDDRGCLTVLAVDHRDALRAEIDPAHPEAVADSALTTFKSDIVNGFGSRPSAVMLDPEYSLPLFEPGALPAGVGSLCALEAQGYLGEPGVRTNTLLPGWDPARVAALGASAAKLLILYRPDSGDVARQQDDLVRTVVEGCEEADLPVFVEPVPYDVVDADDRERTVLGSVERLAPLAPTVLKMPFPAAVDRPERWEPACRAVSELTELPWAVLSWGVAFDVFVGQVEAACANGASGFMAGRAIWREALVPDERARAIEQIAVPRFDRLVTASVDARPVLA